MQAGILVDGVHVPRVEGQCKSMCDVKHLRNSREGGQVCSECVLCVPRVPIEQMSSCRTAT